MNDLNKRIEESHLNLGDAEASKRRMASENADLLRQLQELENAAALLIKEKMALVSSLDEQKRICDDESKERVSLLSKYRNLEHEAEGIKSNFDEESCARANIQIQLKKAQDDADLWRRKYEIDGIARAEELEMAKLKLQARLAENQSTIEQLNGKLAAIEKSKMKTQSDIQDMGVQLDQAQIFHNQLEKKAKQYDRVVGDWKLKVDSLGRDLDTAQK